MTQTDVKSRGRRVLPEDADRWADLYRNGQTFHRIAMQEGRHTQTVEKHVKRALTNSGAVRIRQDALRQQLVLHWQQLADLCSSLQDQFVLPNPTATTQISRWNLEDAYQMGDSRQRLLLQGLREDHAGNERLWGLVSAWEVLISQYIDLVSNLEAIVVKEVNRLSTELKDVKFFDEFRLLVGQHLRRLAHGAPEGIFDVPLRWVDGVNGDELWWGGTIQLAIGQKPLAEEAFHRIANRIAVLDVNSSLAACHTELQSLRPTILEDLEVLALRGAFIGHCRLCPV